MKPSRQNELMAMLEAWLNCEETDGSAKLLTPRTTKEVLFLILECDRREKDLTLDLVSDLNDRFG